MAVAADFVIDLQPGNAAARGKHLVRWLHHRLELWNIGIARNRGDLGRLNPSHYILVNDPRSARPETVPKPPENCSIALALGRSSSVLPAPISPLSCSAA